METSAMIVELKEIGVYIKWAEIYMYRKLEMSYVEIVFLLRKLLKQMWKKYLIPFPVNTREDGSAGGGQGEECRAVRANRKEASPAALLVKSRSQQKSFLFLLEEKIRRAQIRKSEENFFAGWRALASGGGAASFVGGRLKMGSDFVQGVEPNESKRRFKK